MCMTYSSFTFLQISPNQLNLVRNIRSIVSEQVSTVHVPCDVLRGTATVLLYCMCTAVHWACTVDLVFPCAVLPVLCRVLWLSLVLCPALESRDKAFPAPKQRTYWGRRWGKRQNIMHKPACHICQHCVTHCSTLPYNCISPSHAVFIILEFVSVDCALLALSRYCPGQHCVLNG